MEWINLLQIPVLSILTAHFLYTIFRYGARFNIYSCAYYFFFVFFVLPEFVAVIYEKPDLGFFYGFKLMRDDNMVDFIYLLFISVNAVVFQKNTVLHSMEMQSFSYRKAIQNIRIPRIVHHISFLVTLFPTISALLAPRPSLYFFSFIPFYQRDLYSISSSDLNWHFSFMTPWLVFAFFAALVLWLDAPKYEGTSKYHIYRLYTFLVALEVLMFFNKRAMGTILFTLMILIDICFKKKFPIIEVILGFSGLIAYFIIYHIVSGKAGAHISYSQIWSPVYHLYFSRAIDMKFVIYSLLHPDHVKILDYPCQTFVFDIFFFIPRDWWPSKPYPFGIYYMMAFSNRPLQAVVGHMRLLASIFAEITANLGWIGLPISTIAYCRMLKFFSGLKNEAIKMYTMLVSILLIVFPLGSVVIYMFCFIILYVFLEKKWRLVFRG